MTEPRAKMETFEVWSPRWNLGKNASYPMGSNFDLGGQQL